MSALRPTTEADGQPAVTRDDLRAYFHQAAKPQAAWRVGAEFEKFAVDRADGRHLTYAEPGGIRDLLSALSRRFGWEPVHNQTGHITALVRGHALVSLEPGGQVEFSTSPVARLGEIATQLTSHLKEVKAVFDPGRVAWLACGAAPLARVEDIPLMPRVRHAVMAEYLPRRSPLALHMMKATASTQAAFDFADEADAAAKFTVALKLGPVVNALWGNAPLYAGRPTGFVSYRGRIWEGMDPDRSGLLTDLLRRGFSFDGYIDYLLDVPMMFTCVRGQYRPAGGRTFRDFMAKGLDGHFPTLADWEVQLTTVFPEVRLKKFLEVRGADAGPAAPALSVPAFWKGLLYDAESREAAAEIARPLPPEELPAAFALAYRHGLAATVRGRTLRDWCRELAALAADGLAREARRTGNPDERPYLDPVFAVLERGRSPGAEYLERGPSPAEDLAGVVRWFEV